MNLPYCTERISKTLPPVLYEKVPGVLAFLDKMKPSKVVHLPVSISSEY